MENACDLTVSRAYISEYVANRLPKV